MANKISNLIESLKVVQKNYSNTPATKTEAWVDLLYLCKECGHCIESYIHFQARWIWSRSKIVRFFLFLEDNGYISRKENGNGTIKIIVHILTDCEVLRKSNGNQTEDAEQEQLDVAQRRKGERKRKEPKEKERAKEETFNDPSFLVSWSR